MPREIVKKINWFGFVRALVIAIGSSLFISMEDATVTNIELLRAVVSGIVSAFAFFDCPTQIIRKKSSNFSNK